MARSTREGRVTVLGIHIQIRNLISREKQEITLDQTLSPLSCDIVA